MLRWLSLFVFVPSLATADAIMPFDGVCPPGLESAISSASHSEVCAPSRCANDAECGRGAACRAVHECWAEGEIVGRFGQRRRGQRVVGLCGADQQCAEAGATCQTRRQCEPTAPTPAWDPAQRRWTGVSHPGPPREEPGPTVGAAAASAPAESGGCSAAHGSRGLVPMLLLLAALAWHRAPTKRARR
jgi:hypothetical protein